MWLFLWTTAKTKQGNHAFFTQQTRNEETAHYNFCTHPSNPTRCVLFPLYFLGFGPILLCILEEVCRPTIPRPGLGSSTSRKTKRQKSGAQTKRQGGEIRSSRKWYKGGTFGLLFLLLVRGNDAGGEQAHLVRRRRRQRRKKTTTLKWRDRTAGCAADGSRFQAKRWCRGLA